ncbi:MAG TPA: hypothetical protein VJ624_06060 [Thermodesulfobacteriota bacterium]|nr:hypothetical protein [Thermodesulfobacteriota bacterium]
MKKTIIFIVALSLTIAFLPVTPAKAHHDSFWPGFAVGIGTAIILDSFSYGPGYYYPSHGHYYYHPDHYYHPRHYYKHHRGNQHDYYNGHERGYRGHGHRR